MFNIRKLFFSYNGIVVVLQKEGSESLSFRHIETFTFCPLKLCLHLLNLTLITSYLLPLVALKKNFLCGEFLTRTEVDRVL